MTDKIEQFWRDATAEDTTSGKRLAARFRDYPNGGWADNRTLAGWRRIAGEPSLLFYDEAGVAWFQCQVYEPQQWWLDKPDPGEGYRLLEKFPDEDKLGTDEAWDVHKREWRVTSIDDGIQCEEVWYRRRIEPVKQDAGSTCASNIPKGWTALSDDEPRLASDAYWSALVDSWVLIGDARLESANRDKWPAIRQVEHCRCMMLMEGCFYRLPGGQGIKVTKQGFELE
jgi:hypothetical protein